MRLLVLILGYALATSLHAQTYFLQGTATFMGDDCYRLTQAANTQNGAVWYADQIDLTQSFDIEFLMNFGTIDAQGADGICFVLQTVGNNALGQSGGGLGFLGFSPAFAVEFDTYQNGDFGDPFYDHIGMVSNGSVNHNGSDAIAGPVQASTDNINIEDGVDHVVRIVWNPANFHVDVYFDCELRLTGVIDLVNNIFNGQTSVFWGFTAATGGAVNNQTVCLQENILSTGPDALVCTGGSVQLSAAGDPEGSFLWEPSDFLDDPTSQTPISSPPNDITYTVTYTNLCGQTLEGTVNVQVEDLVLSIAGSVNLNCTNDVSTLTVTSNFGPSTDYLWSTSDGEFDTGTDAPSVIVSAGGTYLVSGSFQENCTATAQVEVNADFAAPDFSLSSAGNLDCVTSTSTLTSTNLGLGYTFSWSTANGSLTGPPNTPNTTATSAGTYNLSVTNTGNGCSATETIEVADLTAFPTIVPGAADTLSCRNLQSEIVGTIVNPSQGQFSWTTFEGNIISGANSLAPTVNQPGWYIFTVTNPENGCTSTDSVWVVSEEQVELDLSTLVFPNIFSPNNDGTNDRWAPYLLAEPDLDLMSYFTKYDLKIYNRWGSVVFDTNGSTRVWEGRDEGNDLEEGVYYFILNYTLSCATNADSPASGSVHLVR
jgi:gliding motility-associated-like protein